MKTTPKIKVTTYKIKSGNCKGWYDCRVWKDGILLRHTSGTAFETKEKAQEYGDYLKEEYQKQFDFLRERIILAIVK